VLSQATGTRPVIMLDDVMSELDHKRRDYIPQSHRENQVLNTCCDPSYFKSVQRARTFTYHQEVLSGLPDIENEP
jgi:DNA replication and repair protein RecF